MIPRPRVKLVLMSSEENEVIEFRVWNEVADLLGEHDNVDDANVQVKAERDSCPCGTDGMPECGVLHPHGIFIQVCEDGYDITNSYLG